jgi:hypothetical protein
VARDQHAVPVGQASLIGAQTRLASFSLSGPPRKLAAKGLWKWLFRRVSSGRQESNRRAHLPVQGYCRVSCPARQWARIDAQRQGSASHAARFYAAIQQLKGAWIGKTSFKAQQARDAPGLIL